MPVLLIQLVLNVGVVTPPDRHIPVLNECLLQAQFFENVFLDLPVYPSRSPLSPVRDREVMRIIPVCLQELKEPTALNPF